NDQPDVYVVQLDPNTTHEDGNSIVLEGYNTASSEHPATEQIDKYDIQLAIAPEAGKTVTVKISPSDPRACLQSSDSRFFSSTSSPDPTLCPLGGTTYFASFTAADWLTPLHVTIHARNDSATEDPHNTGLIHTIYAVADPAFAGVAGLLVTNDSAYVAQAPTIQ